MKTNGKKIIGIGIVVTLLVGTSFMVWASYDPNAALKSPAVRSSITKTSPNLSSHIIGQGDVLERKINGTITPLDLLFEGVSSSSATNSSQRAGHKNFPLHQVGMGGIYEVKIVNNEKKEGRAAVENSPLDLLFQGLISPASADILLQIRDRKQGSVVPVRNNLNTLGANGNTPLDLLFLGVEPNGSDQA